jgi:riboflavin transporter FmnP
VLLGTRKLRPLVTGALLAAISFVLLTAASLLPSGRLALTAAAGIPVGVAVMRYDLRAGVLTWLISSLLCLIFLPQKAAAILYFMAFGSYPLVKSLCEHRPRRVGEWALKILFCNLILFLLVWLAPVALGLAVGQTASPLWLLVWIGVNAVFVVYDVALTRLFAFLYHRLK